MTGQQQAQAVLALAGRRLADRSRPFSDSLFGEFAATPVRAVRAGEVWPPTPGQSQRLMWALRYRESMLSTLFNDPSMARLEPSLLRAYLWRQARRHRRTGLVFTGVVERGLTSRELVLPLFLDAEVGLHLVALYCTRLREGLFVRLSLVDREGSSLTPGLPGVRVQLGAREAVTNEEGEAVFAGLRLDGQRRALTVDRETLLRQRRVRKQTPLGVPERLLAGQSPAALTEEQ